MSSELSWVTLESPYSGKSYEVHLTSDEIERCETDSAFFESLCLKYDKLQENNILYAKDGTEDTGPSQLLNENNLFLTLPENLEESFISLVQERPVLWNFKLPLRERSREIIERSWKEIVEELGINISVATLKSKWKSLRDSFIRARNNINRKIPSGASATERVEMEKLKARHKHYELLEFLTTNLDLKKTATNIMEDEVLDNSCHSSETQSNSKNKKTRLNSESSNMDAAFISAVQNLANPQEKLTGTQHFCMRLADSLERLPRVIKNNVELKILQLVVEAENEYVCNQN